MKAETFDAPVLEERKGRKASKETRRLQLIEATIDSLARRGYSETTMANVSDGAGLSRGIVNFHFESKDKLLVATLHHMADEYAAHWRNALERADDTPSARLLALVKADFDRAICNRRKLAAWCAFWGETKSRPTYQALCGGRDAEYENTLVELAGAIIEEGGYELDVKASALGIGALLEGLWLRLLMSASLSREQARTIALRHLAATFPRHFGQDILP